MISDWRIKTTKKTNIKQNPLNLAVKLKTNGALTDDTNGIFISKFDNHFEIPTTGTDANKLKLKLKSNSGLDEDSNGLFVKLKSNGGIIHDATGLKVVDNTFHPKITSLVNTTSTALVNSTISFNTAKTQLIL